MPRPLELFLSDAEGLMPRLRNALQAGAQPRWDEALRLLHTFKGNASALGQPTLARYAHALESAFARFQDGTWQWGPQSAHAIALAVDALAAALVLLSAGDEPDLIAPMRVFAKGLKEAQAAALTTQPTMQSEANTHVVPEADSDYVLLVKVGGEEFTLPTTCVQEVIHRPEVLPVVGALFRPFEGGGGHTGRLVRSNGRLMSLLPLEALLPHGAPHPARPIRASLPWVVILKHLGAHERRDMVICVPVDEVLEVCHAGVSSGSARFVTPESIKAAAEKIAS